MSGSAWTVVPGALSRSPVRVRIARVADRPALWQGRAETDTDIVAVALSRSRGNLQWSRSGRHGPWTDDRPGLHLGIWISELDHATLAGPVSVQLRLAGAAPAWSVMARTRTPVRIHEHFDTTTGSPAPILHIPGDDPLDVAILFVARADVRSLRAGAWRARDPALHGVPDPWTTILTGPRSGTHPR
jgi:hypothetical protein